MKRFLSTALLLLISLPFWATAKKSQVQFADPYILLEGGKYYAYGTGYLEGIKCFSSDDLRVWKDEGTALAASNTTRTKWFWAPEVYHVGNRYLMYYSAEERLFVAESTSPKGPFKQIGDLMMKDVLGDAFCIDSSVFFDDDGSIYLFFVRNNDGNNIWQIELEEDAITPKASTLQKCFAVSQSWEMKKGRVVEGPNVVKVGSRYFLTYSGNDYQSQDYAVGYAYTTNIKGAKWTKYAGNPILKRADGLVGTGHHSLFRDKEDNLRIVFHAHNSETTIHPRCMYIGSMEATSSKLSYINVPAIRPTTDATHPNNPEMVNDEWAVENGQAVTVDVNNSGVQDIVVAGFGNSVSNKAGDERTSHRLTYINLYSTTLHQWRKCTTVPAFQVADRPSLVPCDINNDGYMDMVAFDATGEDTEAEAYTHGYCTEGIFLGNGTGAFTAAKLNFTHPDGTPCTFDIHGPSAAQIIDTDNDGQLDIVCTGQQGDQSYNVILHNQGINATGEMHFCVEPFETELAFSNTIIQAADMNNDGYQDIVISSSVDNNAEQGVFTDIYMNRPEARGTFQRLNLGVNGGTIKRKAKGGLVVADFNGDGWTDIMLSGTGEASSGEATVRQRIYMNQRTATPTFSAVTGDLLTDTYNSQSCANNAIGIIDWNGDGMFDAISQGFKGAAKASSAQLYLNDGTGRLRRSSVVPGCSAGTIAFPDYDNDGRKDYLTIGNCTDASHVMTEEKGIRSILCYNLQSSPRLPQAPLALAAEVEADSVVLTWEAAPGEPASATYDIYICDENGNLLNSTPAYIGGKQDGLRKTNTLGRVGGNCRWVFRPSKAGTYTWGVQTVNAAYIGSAFTAGPAFTVEDESTGIATPKADTAPQPIYNTDGTRTTSTSRGLKVRKGRKWVN